MARTTRRRLESKKREVSGGGTAKDASNEGREGQEAEWRGGRGRNGG